MNRDSPMEAVLPLNPAVLQSRLIKRLSLPEAVGLLVSLLFMIAFLRFISAGHRPFDFTVYMQAAEGNLADFYYADWLRPLFVPFSVLQLIPGYLAFSLLGLLGIWFAGRIFSGDSGLALLTYQTLYNLFMGTYLGILVGGLALFWWGSARKKWWVAGTGLVLASAKPHTGFLIALLLFLYAEIAGRIA